MTDLDLGHERVRPLANALGVDDTTRALAFELAHRADYTHPINRCGSAIASAAIYLAGRINNDPVSQAAIAEMGGASEQAISETYQLIAEYEDTDIRERPPRLDEYTKSASIKPRFGGEQA